MHETQKEPVFSYEDDFTAESTLEVEVELCFRNKPVGPPIRSDHVSRKGSARALQANSPNVFLRLWLPRHYATSTPLDPHGIFYATESLPMVSRYKKLD